MMRCGNSRCRLQWRFRRPVADLLKRVGPVQKATRVSIYVGLDIGGTKLMVAAGDSTGAIIKVARQPTPVDLNEGLNLLDEMIREVIGDQRPAGIGVAIGGPLDW